MSEPINAFDTRSGSRRKMFGVVAAGGLAGLGLLGRPAHAAVAGGSGGVRQVADRAMDRFDRGWRTGDWEPFLAMLTPRFSFWFPEGQWRGRHEGEAGRRAIAEWARFHGTSGNRVSGERRSVAVMGDRVLYEYDSRGASSSTAGYLNWETIIVQVRGERISALHEYWGNVPPTGN
ncbi:nuclear transport factor 2 family protein [Nonomuraea jiangxiensis]|uniref:Ketosteroid isomerase-related protein n=1 Tax=Nonomuraea jiangxiensis TaxID=633440 RepID=A0A1G8QLJ1_9ACTN|nr:nuclear transport factor 2 family protein [Nonomuraea jiangxiensis]SDJ05622.1 Ketosteroid isomerase-related protein [Nonomuraea jiangxiensis]